MTYKYNSNRDRGQSMTFRPKAEPSPPVTDDDPGNPDGFPGGAGATSPMSALRIPRRAVPFTHNRAEWALHMTKLQMKITGGFRTGPGPSASPSCGGWSRPPASGNGTSSTSCGWARMPPCASCSSSSTPCQRHGPGPSSLADRMPMAGEV